MYYLFIFIFKNINREKSSTIKWNCDLISNMNSVADAIRAVQFWIRLATLLLYPLKNALLFVLHNTEKRTDYVGLPKDETELYKWLSQRNGQIIKLQKKNVLSKLQVDTLLPPGENKTDSTTFDVTLIIVLITNFTKLPKPKDGWKILDPTDNSLSLIHI